MTRLTKIEKETILLFNEGESTASIYTYNAGWQLTHLKCIYFLHFVRYTNIGLEMEYG